MRIGIIGAGNMAAALARGWREPVLVTDGGSGRAAALADELGGEALTSNSELADRAELVVLCHKPGQLEAVASEIDGRAGAVVSILGGTQLLRLRAAYGRTPVARVMPNTPVEVRAGVTLLCSDPDADADLHARVRELFERVGLVIELPEQLLEVGSALSGVGPAYVALVAEAQVDAAVRKGMPARRAAELVEATLAGTATLLEVRGHDTLAVRREVTSPGGGTARGLDALERAGLRTAFSDATDAVIDWSAR